VNHQHNNNQSIKPKQFSLSLPLCPNNPYWYKLLADLYASLESLFIQTIPRMWSYFVDLESLIRISIHDSLHEISSFGRNKLWNREIASYDFLIQKRRIWILERKISTNQREHDDSRAPYIHTKSFIFPPSDHLRCCIAWRPTCCLQELSRFVHIW